jgi:hypothetical protein
VWRPSEGLLQHSGSGQKHAWTTTVPDDPFRHPGAMRRTSALATMESFVPQERQDRERRRRDLLVGDEQGRAATSGRACVRRGTRSATTEDASDRAFPGRLRSVSLESSEACSRPALHRHFDAAVDEPDVGGPGRGEADHHPDLHEEPIGGGVGHQVMRRREERERHHRHPPEQSDLEEGQ